MPQIKTRLFPILVRVLLAAFVLLACCFQARATYTDPALVCTVNSGTSGANQPIVSLKSGPAAVALSVSATNFTPTSYTWSQVADTLNDFATTGTAQFASTVTTVPQVGVTISTPGIYQFHVVATGSGKSAGATVWVNAWDAAGALNPNHYIGRNPDINPPTSVRVLSPDPGPYCHPRLLFTRADWPELNAKTASVPDVTTAVASLQSSLNGNFYLTSTSASSLNNIASIYYTYGSGGYDAAYFANTVAPAYTSATAAGIMSDLMLGHNPGGAFFDALVSACYLQWIGTDPKTAHPQVSGTVQAQFTYLATVVAAAAKVELIRSGTNGSYYLNGAPAFYDMAVCYDLMFDWMTPQQQNDTRDYLYAIGYLYYNTGGGGLSRTQPSLSPFQNGDFPNLADGCMLAALAIEGEESSVSAAVQSAFGPTLPYAGGASAWPYASPVSVFNLHRQLLWNCDWALTPWGYIMNVMDYFQLGANVSMPAALAIARRGGENQFVTTPYYQTSLAAIYTLAPREKDNAMVMFDHHDGTDWAGGSNQRNAAYIVRYMYPDDPMIDYAYRSFRNQGEFNALAQAIFSTGTTAQGMASMAQSKGLALTKFDPQRAVVTTRNSWNENDLCLSFENRFDFDGHMHAERNNFSLYALGRAWASPPGYHCTINDLQSTVLIQNPALVSDSATAGYIGQSPSSATTTSTSGNFPTPPGKLLEITEDPALTWSLFAGDASAAYNWGYLSVSGSGQTTPPNVDTGVRTSSFMVPGLLQTLAPAIQSYYATNDVVLNQLNYNSVQYAFRTVFTVRGSCPYVLVVDDINKDGTGHNYRWSMPCAISFGPGSGNRFVDGNGNDVFADLTLQSGTAANEAIAWHSPIDDQKTQGQAGLPRLLIRDLSELNGAHPPNIFLDYRPDNYAGGNLTYGWDNNSKAFTYLHSDRVMIERDNVADPAYKVLLFPYVTGSGTPVTSWDATNTVLTISLPSGFVDKITFDKTQADHRTRISGFQRAAGHPAPTLSFASNVTVAATGTAPGGIPGGAAVFAVSGTDYLGNTLVPTLSCSSGAVFPVGVNTVVATVKDALGQVTSGTFSVTVLPSAPVVSMSQVFNFASSGTSFGCVLTWPDCQGGTGYNVKRSTTPGGPYTTVSSNQSGTTFTDSGLTNIAYYYVVSALLSGSVGPNSAEVNLNPPSGVFTGGALGSDTGDGAYNLGGGAYLLSTKSGGAGAFSEQCSFLSTPWTGDGSFTVRLASVYALSPATLSQFCQFGVMIRNSFTSNDVMAYADYDTFVQPVGFHIRATSGAAGSSSGPGISTFSPPAWLRLVRSGTAVRSYYSYDGANWAPIAAAAGGNFSSNIVAGVFCSPDAGNGTENAVFDNFVFLGTPTVAVTGSGMTLTWQGLPSTPHSVLRSVLPNGPFQTIATAVTGTTYTDPTISGGPYYYQILASGSQGGSTLSTIVSATGVVADLTPPCVTVPVDIVAEATGAVGAPVSFTTSAVDGVSGSCSTFSSIASGAMFPIGTTTVVVTATDAAGNTGTNSFSVMVRDSAPPALTLPSNLVVMATGSATDVNFSASAYDMVSGSCPVVCSPASGSGLPIGVTTVRVSTADGAGNTSTGAFQVTVLSSTPTIVVPASITVAGTSAGGAVVSFTTSATDAISGSCPTVNTPASGTLYPVGTTAVVVTATNAFGVRASATFTVTVNQKTPTVSSSPLLHLDASVPSTFLTDTTGRVSRWNDLDGGSYYVDQATVANQPSIALDGTLNRQVVDFGAFHSDATGAWLQLKTGASATHFTTIRSAFVVMKGGNFFLSDDSTYNFYRGGDIVSGTSPLWNSTYALNKVTGGSTYLNGGASTINGTTAAMPSGFWLADVITTGNATSSHLANDRSIRTGGQQVGEVMIYSSALSTTDRKTIEAYLYTKWFGSGLAITAPPNLTLDATGPGGAVANFTVSASQSGTAVPCTAAPASGLIFPLGVSTVVATATSTGTNPYVATKTFTVTVQDTTPPGLVIPPNITVPATSGSGAVVTFSPTASDVVSGSCEVACAPASGSMFPVGTTTVNLLATDAAGNTSTGSFTVTVLDQTPPSITAPPDITAEAAGPYGAVVSFSTLAVDAVTGPCATSATPASGSIFPVGTTPVLVTAIDGFGNSGTTSFTVTIRDTTPPVLFAPSTLRMVATGSTGATLALPWGTYDLVSGTCPVVYTPASGSFFPIGTTIVTATSADSAGNVASGTIAVTVTPQAPVRGTNLKLHLDASIPSTLVTDPGGRVSRWNDVDGGTSYVAQPAASNQPLAALDGTLALNVVDFGTFNANSSGDWLQFKDGSGNDLRLTTLRTVFIVMKGGNFILSDNTTVDFHRAFDSSGNCVSGTCPIWHPSYGSNYVKSGTTFLNGGSTPIPGTTTPMPAGWFLLDVTTTGNCTASHLAEDRTYRTGGQQIGELLIYDRVLTSAERKATEGYLMLKWFGTDLVPPVVAVPANITVEATGPAGAAVSFATSATDNADGTDPTIAMPAPGSVFPLGTTTVVVTATDAAGNSGSNTFTVTVRDTTPPAIRVPPDLTLYATSASGAYVSFSTSGTDLVSGSVATTNTPSSGSLFPIGTTTVTTTARDTAGITGSAAFHVTVAVVPISASETSAPRIAVSGTSVNVKLPAAIPGRSYQLQRTDSLISGSWTSVGPMQIGNAQDLILPDLYNPAIPTRFYRLQLGP